MSASLPSGAGPTPPGSRSTTRFVLVRHGEADGNRELRYLGSTDAPLTARGEEQARQLATALAAFPLTALYASPLARARETARLIAAALDLEVCVEPGLREQDFGAWEALTRADVVARYPALLAAWEAGEELAPPDGESLTDMRTRVVAHVSELAERHRGETVALVSHVGPIKALVCAALDLPPAGVRRMWLDTASICVIDWRPDGSGGTPGVLRVFNAVAHLDPPARWLAR